MKMLMTSRVATIKTIRFHFMISRPSKMILKESDISEGKCKPEGYSEPRVSHPVIN